LKQRRNKMDKVTNITFDGKFGTLTKVGKIGGISFTDEEIKSLVKEALDSTITGLYPEIIYSTAGKGHFGLNDYTISFWRKAQLSDGRIERNVVRVDRHPDEVVVVGKVDDKDSFENICSTLLVFPEDYDLEYDPNEHSLHTKGGEVVLQNIFFSDVDDALRYKEIEEEKEEAERARRPIGPPEEEIPEAGFEELLKEQFGEEEAPLPEEEGAIMPEETLPPVE